LPPRPPPKNENITQREPSARWPASESALMVPKTDGLSHANNPISTATIPPVEILEAAYPVVFTQWARP
jgi:hypothetical protein